MQYLQAKRIWQRIPKVRWGIRTNTQSPNFATTEILTLNLHRSTTQQTQLCRVTSQYYNQIYKMEGNLKRGWIKKQKLLEYLENYLGQHCCCWVPLVAISHHQLHSVAISPRHHQLQTVAVSCHQWPSVTISGHQSPSVSNSHHQSPTVTSSHH